MSNSTKTPHKRKKRREGFGSIERRGDRHYWRYPKHLYPNRPRVPLGIGMSDERAREKRDALVERGLATGELKALLDRLLERSTRRRSDTPRNPTTATTVRELMTAWTTGDLYQQHGAIFGLKSSMASGKIVEWTLEKHALTLKTRSCHGPELGDLPVKDVNENDIAVVMQRHKGSATTRQHTHKNLKRLFAISIVVCKLRPEGSNPVKPHFRPASDPAKHFNFLYPPELLALLACNTIPLGRRVLYLLAFYWGARKGSLYALIWRCIDFIHGTVSLTVMKGGKRLESNNDADHGTPVFFVSDPNVIATLAAWRDYCGTPEADCLVIRDLGLRPGHDEAKVLREDLMKAGVTREILFSTASNVEPIRFHDGRASFCTWARKAGKSDAWIRERTGHSPSGKMIDRYTRQAQTLADLGYEPFPDVSGAIPELAQLSTELSTSVSTSSDVDNSGTSHSPLDSPEPMEFLPFHHTREGGGTGRRASLRC